MTASSRPRHVASVLLVAVFAWLIADPTPAPAHATNVIVMVADGAGFNCWDATSMYQGKWDANARRSTQICNGPGWIASACATYPLNTSKTPTGKGTQDPTVVYDPARAWDPKGGYEWLKGAYTDSAAAATALSTGRKTYNNSINWSDLDKPLAPTLTERAKSAGRSTGIVTTVQWSHATPAGFSHARARERDDYESIATQMLTGDTLDVIMGAGNPDFDNDGLPARKRRDYKYVGGEDAWQAVETARTAPDGTCKGFRPVSTRAEFEALLSGPTPARVLGTVQVGVTLRQARVRHDVTDPAKDTPVNPALPDLTTMVLGAINVLDANPRGFFLMVEGGAVDWANHANQPGRMIEEMADYLKAVEAVSRWVETHGGWERTLLVLTADHETGLLWGPNSDTAPFDPIADRGPGVVPALRYNHKSHTNSLVPLYARGPGAERFAQKIVGRDPVRGPYVNNTAVCEVVAETLAP